MIRCAIPLGFVLLAACGPSSDGLVAHDKDVTDPGMIECALDAVADFTRDCTIQRFVGRAGITVVIGRADSGFRRFELTDDGSGLVTADGAERARVTIIEGNRVEVRVGDDRYRLPARFTAAPPSESDAAP
ncbi:MAG: hypothetical protein GW859_01655 [Sphingomonadales bacterium]|nr:hypothetical protein [Sphingomonadales bacterium]